MHRLTMAMETLLSWFIVSMGAVLIWAWLSFRQARRRCQIESRKIIRYKGRK